MFDLQVLVCLKCCWSVWACETRRPSASKPLRLPDCPDECTSFLAFPDPLFRQQSNDWKRMINTTHLAKFKFKKKKCEIFSFDDNSFVYHQVYFVCLFVYFCIKIASKLHLFIVFLLWCCGSENEAYNTTQLHNCLIRLTYIIIDN